jgi:hypothetical protein
MLIGMAVRMSQDLGLHLVSSRVIILFHFYSFNVSGY